MNLQFKITLDMILNGTAFRILHHDSKTIYGPYGIGWKNGKVHAILPGVEETPYWINSGQVMAALNDLASTYVASSIVEDSPAHCLEIMVSHMTVGYDHLTDAARYAFAKEQKKSEEIQSRINWLEFM